MKKLTFRGIPLRGILHTDKQVLAAQIILALMTILGSQFLLEFSCTITLYDLQEHLLAISWDYVLLNFLTLGAVWAVFLLILRRFWLANLLFGIVCGGIAIANHFVIKFHTMPLSFLTLRNFKTAMNVISSYDFSIGRMALVLILGLAGLIALPLAYRYAVQPSKRPLRQVLIRDVSLILAACTVMYFGYFSKNPVKPRHTITWKWTVAYYEYGYAACTIETLFQSLNAVNPPDGYSDAAVEKLDIVPYGSETPAAPDIILILNETFYDLRLITDLETDVPYLDNIENLENVRLGYAVVPGAGGGTNSSEYELLTSNSLQLMPGITPFNSLDLNGANSLVSYLQDLDYSTAASHAGPAVNYSRGIGYKALRFDDIYFVDSLVDTEFYYDRRNETDATLYRNNLVRWYEDQPEDAPRFQYMLTIQNHGGYEMNKPEYDLVHTLNDFGEYTQQVNEYLTSISLSDQAFKELTDYFSQVDRPVVVCMVGDHAPSFASSIADSSLSKEERELRLRQVPLMIWANFPLEEQELGTMSMNYVVPTLLEIAGVELSPYYSYLLQTKEQVPVLTSYGYYYDTEGNRYAYDSDEGSPYAELVKGCFYLEYYNLQKGENQSLFRPYSAKD